MNDSVLRPPQSKTANMASAAPARWSVGDRLHLAWRLRMRPTPRIDDQWQIIEQYSYARANEHIAALDPKGWIGIGRQSPHQRKNHPY